ncbi:FecR domain-containing protein [Fulvimonas soli]|uniref:FecR family protein n=1 Tax=Fulvimonas soli TaxID=155197 RepID=A0A316IJ70_9GAMM|nr:FecR domain-containing protein [Fulvimonas soli]PWK92970.1 FecR family protein [Fulvimonas soli]TNY26550.1 hypothetical protein BV497_07905 [Fulvimonas soli]
MHARHHPRPPYPIWLAATLLAGLAVLPARAGDWTYRVHPDDNIWTLARRYLKADVPWQQLQDYNHVADPYHLLPGSRLRIPVQWLRVEPASATVAAAIGDARAWLPGQAQPVPVTPGMRLGYGARVETGTDASLTLEFADGSRMLVQGGSEVSLDRMSAYGRTGMADTRVRLQRGRVVNDVTPMPGNAAHFVVQTPGAVSSVRGTHFRVAADDARARTEVEVLGGRVEVTGDRRHVQVRKGSGVAVEEGRRPGRVRRLLPAPALRCPAAPVVRPAYALDWQAQPGAAAYRVQIAHDRRFAALLYDHVTDALPHASLPDLPNGDYLLRVRGIEPDRLEGLDATCALRIATHPQPPLVQEPQPGGTARAERPRFRWTESSEAASYAWQLAADPQFRQLLAERQDLADNRVRAPAALPPGRYYWRVASRDREGRLGPYTDALPFDRADAPPAPALATLKRSGDGLTLGWSAGAPGQRYRIQMARDPDFAHPVVDSTVEQPSLTLRKPASGTWYVRLRVVDDDEFAGAWGPAQKVRLPCIPCRIALGTGGAALLWLLL